MFQFRLFVILFSCYVFVATAEAIDYPFDEETEALANVDDEVFVARIINVDIPVHVHRFRFAVLCFGFYNLNFEIVEIEIDATVTVTFEQHENYPLPDHSNVNVQ